MVSKPEFWTKSRRKKLLSATKSDVKTAVFTSVSVAHLAQMVAFLLDFMTPFIIRRLPVSSQLHFEFLAESDNSSDAARAVEDSKFVIFCNNIASNSSVSDFLSCTNS